MTWFVVAEEKEDCPSSVLIAFRERQGIDRRRRGLCHRFVREYKLGEENQEVSRSSVLVNRCSSTEGIYLAEAKGHHDISNKKGLLEALNNLVPESPVILLSIGVDGWFTNSEKLPAFLHTYSHQEMWLVINFARDPGAEETTSARNGHLYGWHEITCLVNVMEEQSSCGRCQGLFLLWSRVKNTEVGRRNSDTSHRAALGRTTRGRSKLGLEGPDVVIIA